MILALSPELESIGWGLAAVGITLVTLSMVLGIRKKRKKMSGQVTARENLERYKAKGEVRDDLERVMVEVEEMARRVASQLDAKSVAVERLLRDADERIARLEAVIDQLDAGTAHRHAATTADPPGDQNPAESSDPQAPPADQNPRPRPSPGTADPLSRQVYELADQGHTAPDIARQLDEHIGKVELILALRSA